MSFFPRAGLMQPVEGGAYVAQGAVVTGDVTLGEDVGVWFQCVLRGDDAPLVIGARTNVQDLTMIHADPGMTNVIGSEVTIGHRVVLHGVSVGDRALIGMGAVIQDNAVIGRGSVVASGAVVTEKAVVPPNSLVVGMPAKVKKTLTEKESSPSPRIACQYLELAREHKAIAEDQEL